MTERLLLAAIAAVVLVAGAGSALAKIRRCVNPVTHKVSMSDLDCPADRAPTPVETAASEQAEKEAIKVREIRRVAERADLQLFGKFPDEATVRAAYVAELQAVNDKLRIATRRLGGLVDERKPIDEERQFFVNKPLSPQLQRSLDRSEAQFAASATVFRELQADIEGIVTKYGRWHDRLVKLWAGQYAGSMGLLDGAAPPPR